MNIRWLKRENTGRLILVFGGWSTTPDMYSDVGAPGWDVLICSGFDGSEFDADLLNGYPTVWLYAWSLGVSAASRMLPADKITVGIAINGTETPRHDSMGIPCAIFDGTRDTLSERNLQKFRMRMCGSASTFRSLSSKFADCEIEQLKHELDWAASDCEVSAPYWKRVYISSEDRIFPTCAQENGWSLHKAHPEITHLQAPHYVDIAHIVTSTIPDYAKVGAKFHHSLSSYDLQAYAQRLIAARLAMMIEESMLCLDAKILEIGQGSGVFTRMYAPLLSVGSITAVDLYPTPQGEYAPEMNYITADAQTWLEGCEDKFDAILSSSAIQWFTDMKRFFRNASRHLSSSGLLACSTFLPGNLSELDELRPSPLLYHPAEELKRMMKTYFGEVEVVSEIVTLRFTGVLDAMSHLAKTGVGGSVHGSTGIREMLSRLPVDGDGCVTLTYRPAYLTARRPLL